MSEIEKLRSFVSTVHYREKQLQSIDPKKGRFPFVTISRETGAGGHNLAEKILELIHKESADPLFQDWQICDQELCQKIAQDPKLKVTPESMLVSEYRSTAEDILTQLITGESAQEKVIRKMFLLMRDLAVYGKSIIIGRGSTCLTRDLPYGVHVRLVASLPSRISLMMKAHDKDERWAKEKIAEQDKAKALLVRNFFHKDIHDPLLFDVILNTDRVDIDEIAHMIVFLIKKKAACVK